MNFFGKGGKGDKDKGHEKVPDDQPGKESAGDVGDVMRDERAGLRDRLEVSKETRERLEESGTKTFFENIFGKGRISKFLSGLTLGLFSRFGLGDEEMNWEEFEKEVVSNTDGAAGEKFDLEEFIVAHRSLGYGREKENTKDAIEAALKGGERQIEIDLRLGDDGEVYVAHDSIKGETGPAEKYSKLSEVLELVANHTNQDVVMFFDIKDRGVLDQLDRMVDKIDDGKKGASGYTPLAKRHFVSSFNNEILARARENAGERPLMFAYIPTVKLKAAKRLLKKANQKRLARVCSALDRLAGTNLEDDLKNTVVRVDDKVVEGADPQATDVLNIYSELPPDNILKNIQYICIPALLATPELVSKAHAKGVKVAVWGAEGIQIQRAIALLKVDLVISDEPDVIEKAA